MSEDTLCAPIPLTIEDIRAKIALLAETDKGEPLRLAMHDLKKALKENPAACENILPIDIHECVKYLEIINGKVLKDIQIKGEMKTLKSSKAKQQLSLDPAALAAKIDEM